MNVSGWKKVWRLIPLMAMLTLLLSGCGGVFDPQGPEAKEQYWLIKLSFFIMLIVLVIVFVIFFYVIIKYRKRKGQTGYPKQVEGNHLLEFLWTAIPICLLLTLIIPMTISTFKLAHDYSKSQDAIHVKVTGHQFWWEFEYSDPEIGIRTATDLVVPVDKKISLEITSADVVHSLWVPSLFGKMDANPGLVNKMYFESDSVGVFLGKCAELCGASHALMDFKVVVKSDQDFNAWVEHMKAPATTAADAVQGEEIFKAKCLQCHAVTPDSRGFGPNLAGFANRETVAGYRPNTTDWLNKWLKDPQEVKPGTLMPNVGLNDQELTDLVKYLQELK